jgi:hypothetical protein
LEEKHGKRTAPVPNLFQLGDYRNKATNVRTVLHLRPSEDVFCTFETNEGGRTDISLMLYVSARRLKEQRSQRKK